MNELEQKNLLQTEAQFSDELSAEDLEAVSGGCVGDFLYRQVERAGKAVGDATQIPGDTFSSFTQGFRRGRAN